MESDKSGYLHEVNTKDCKYEIQFKNPEYIVSKEIAQGADLKKAKSRLKQLNSTIWFNISIFGQDGQQAIKQNVEGASDYQERLSYFLNNAGEQIALYYGDSSLNRVAYLFENSHNISPKDVIVVGFQVPEEVPQKDLTLVYNDIVFKNGPVKMLIKSEKLRKLPKLKLKFDS